MCGTSVHSIFSMYSLILGEELPYPGDCHKYYVCLKGDYGGLHVAVFDCGDWVFDPNTESCTLPGEAVDDLCIY